ncbi:uncharacterized protein LOC135400799 [Ornithodoros turicata]|uniref:uncharacterized protein LOC135400799 n=1 Tax=Ornithodoros turicata TaxID=34597 RepID=UPI0031391F2E
MHYPARIPIRCVVASGPGIRIQEFPKMKKRRILDETSEWQALTAGGSSENDLNISDDMSSATSDRSGQGLLIGTSVAVSIAFFVGFLVYITTHANVPESDLLWGSELNDATGFATARRTNLSHRVTTLPPTKVTRSGQTLQKPTSSPTATATDVSTLPEVILVVATETETSVMEASHASSTSSRITVTREVTTSTTTDTSSSQATQSRTHPKTTTSTSLGTTRSSKATETTKVVKRRKKRTRSKKRTPPKKVIISTPTKLPTTTRPKNVRRRAKVTRRAKIVRTSKATTTSKPASRRTTTLDTSAELEDTGSTEEIPEDITVTRTSTTPSQSTSETTELLWFLQSDETTTAFRTTASPSRRLRPTKAFMPKATTSVFVKYDLTLPDFASTSTTTEDDVLDDPAFRDFIGRLTPRPFARAREGAKRVLGHNPRTI